MDNTKANRAALKLLREHCPQWVLLGCNTHALALMFKDFIKAGGQKERGAALCPGLQRVYKMIGTISNAGVQVNHYFYQALLAWLLCCKQ